MIEETKALMIIVIAICLAIVAIVWININENIEMAKMGYQRCDRTGSSWTRDCIR